MRKRFTCGLVVLGMILICGCGKKQNQESVLEQGLEEDVIESGYEEFVTTEINTMDVSKIFIPMAKQNENLVEPAQKIIDAIRNGEELLDLTEYKLSDLDTAKTVNMVYSSYPPSVMVGMTDEDVDKFWIRFTYPDRDMFQEYIGNFDLTMDDVLTQIMADNTTAESKARAAYEYILNNYEYKDERKSMSDQDIVECIGHFMDEFTDKQLSFYNSNYLYLFLLNQLDIEGYGIRSVSQFEDGDDEIINNEFNGVGKWVWTAIYVHEKFYHTDIAMDMVAKNGLENTNYEMKYFGMSDETRQKDWTIASAWIYTLLGAGNSAKLPPCEEDLVAE